MKFQLCPHSRLRVRFAASLLCLAALLLLSSCGTWLAGFFGSESAPDERFDDSRGMTQPADRNFGNVFSFIFVTDLHIKDGKHEDFRGLKNRLDGAAFVVVGGDITNDGKGEDVNEFIAAREELGVPVYAVPGNHDLFDDGWSNTKRIGPSSFTLKLSPAVRLVCLDSANGTLGTEQTEWLGDVLSDAKESGIVVVTHMNYFSDGLDVASQFSSVEETAMILSMYRNAGVDLTLSGHTHAYEEKNVDSMKVLVGGAFLDDGANDSYLFITCTGADFAVERRWY